MKPLPLLALLTFAGTQASPLQVSGVYPSLTHYNTDNECGPGALVPWAGKLWLVTYPGHKEGLSDDKLYAIDPVTLARTEFPGSVGGTHANRMIHRESQQLFIGCYAIDKDGNVRVISRDKKTGLYGRLTATARHLTDPANKVCMVNMEGAVYEVDVHTLKASLLFEKPVPGHHGKGAYTGQGRLVVSNNGEFAAHGDMSKHYRAPDLPKSPENMGVLAQYDGKTWSIVERRQFTEVTGPGGIEGNASKDDPVWAVGWDKRSVILKLLDGEWSTFRLPKGTMNYDHKGGWYTEWPRIREVGQGCMLMDMHGLFYSFPKTFSAKNPAAPEPISSHLMYTADFCDWNGTLVIGKHDTTKFENPRAGRDQSAPWFGKWEDLSGFGPKQGFGSLWQRDAVKAGVSGAPFLVKGFGHVTLFLSADRAADFRLRTGVVEAGKGVVWTDRDTVSSGAAGEWKTYTVPAGADWVTLVPAADATGVAASFQLTDAFTVARPELFAGLAKVGEPANDAVIRPAGIPSKALQCVFYDTSGKPRYRETDPDTLVTATAGKDETADVEKLCLPKQAEVVYDDASAIVKDSRTGKRYRIPVADEAYRAPFSKRTPTAFREIISERRAANIAGTFFIHGNEAGVDSLQPVATHGLAIRDFCTWRGLLVLSGVKPGAKPDGHVFGSGDDTLWFGKEDDLWLAGKPVGTGGPWKNTAVKSGVASDPYLFFGYDRKTLRLSHDAAAPVTFTVELDADHTGFKTWKTFTVKPGEKSAYAFPKGFSAFWIRLRSDADCKASAILEYR